jgi:hypothetical protein
MTTISTRAARDGLRATARAIEVAAGLALRAAMEATEKTAKSSTDFRDRSGDTRQSIHTRALGFDAHQGFVEAGGAMHFLEWGTGPHAIAAHGKVLRFTVGGNVMFRRSVQHPGVHERPIMRKARDVGAQTLLYAVDHYVGHAIRSGS